VASSEVSLKSSNWTRSCLETLSWLARALCSRSSCSVMESTSSWSFQARRSCSSLEPSTPSIFSLRRRSSLRARLRSFSSLTRPRSAPSERFLISSYVVSAFLALRSASVRAFFSASRRCLASKYSRSSSFFNCSKRSLASLSASSCLRSWLISKSFLCLVSSK